MSLIKERQAKVGDKIKSSQYVKNVNFIWRSVRGFVYSCILPNLPTRKCLSFNTLQFYFYCGYKLKIVFSNVKFIDIG